MPGFSSTYSPLLLSLFLIISAAASFFFYRNSLLSKSKKYFLIALKTIGIFLLLALFIEPALSRLIDPHSGRLDLILIDNSRSNQINNKEQTIRTFAGEKGLFSGDHKVFLFSNTLKYTESADSISLNGFETNLNNALRDLRENFPGRDFNSITIISDGIFTSGGNPLYEAKTFQAPFLTLAIGDTVQQNDIVVRSVASNEKAFTNIPVKIKANVNVYGFNTGAIELNLLREGQIISSRQITLTGNNSYDAEFDVTENSPGKVRYRIEAKGLPGELTDKNNYNDFYITFIDNKVNILVISGGPSYDDAFITGVLRRISNYNITFRTAKSPGEFYEGGIDDRMYAELSALFLLNFPASQSAANVTGSIAEKVKTYKIPVIFFAGKNTDYSKLQAFEESLPFSVSRPNSGESLFNMQIVASEDNPVSRITEINSTAQIFRNVSGIIPKPGAVTLATDKFSGEPVIMTRTSGELKSTAFLGYGLWRWKLNSSSNAEKTLERFLLETINITLQKEKKTKFRVYPEKDFFDYSENIKISAEVFDDNFLPTRNAVLNGKVLKKDGTKAADLNFTASENKYTAEISPLVTGDYYIEADAELNGVYYAKDNSRFTTDTLNTEFLETRTNISALNEISLNTGGKILTKDTDLNSEISNIVNPNSGLTGLLKTVKFNLWENIWVLGLILLFFSAEWALRKRNNIP
jgi:hypothetical protein